MKSHAGPIIAAILLVVMSYIGSYLLMVHAEPKYVPNPYGFATERFVRYRFAEDTCAKVYWPLEQIDKKIRSRVWVELP